MFRKNTGEYANKVKSRSKQTTTTDKRAKKETENRATDLSPRDSSAGGEPVPVSPGLPRVALCVQPHLFWVCFEHKYRLGSLLIRPSGTPGWVCKTRRSGRPVLGLYDGVQADLFWVCITWRSGRPVLGLYNTAFRQNCFGSV